MPMSRFELLMRRLTLVLSLGSAACGTNDPLPEPMPPSSSSSSSSSPYSYPAPSPSPPPAPTPIATPPAPLDSLAQLEADVEAELARLRDLQIVEVRDVVLQGPNVRSEYQRQLPRLRDFVDQAVRAKTNTYPVPVDLGTVEQDLAFLNGLEIASLGDLIAAQPANNPRCYGAPCDTDVAVAKQETGLHAFYLRMWARLTPGK